MDTLSYTMDWRTCSHGPLAHVGVRAVVLSPSLKQEYGAELFAR
jgi:hypothetical protein